MRLGDLDDLKVHISELMLVYSGTELDNAILNAIDNAPTVEPKTKLVANVTFDKEQMEELVEKAKADILAQIERPQGEWEHWGSPFSDEQVANSIVCSVCGARFVEIQDEVFNFCPNCGARMEGEKE